MAWTANRQAIDGGDPDIWGIFEQNQNHLNVGMNTTYLYYSGGTLYISKGMVGINNGSNYYNLINSADASISVAALTASCWAKVELSISAGNVLLEITSIGGETNPASLPATFTAGYDASKGGFYIIATKRVVGLVWINAGGVVEGIINTIGGLNGYAGYSTSNDSSDIIYKFENIKNYTYVPYTADVIVSINSSGTILNLPSNRTEIITRGANGIRRTLPDATLNSGKRIKFINIDSTTSSACTLVPYGAQTISGMSYVFLIEQYQQIEIISDGSNWHIIGGILYWISGGQNTSDWTNRELGFATVAYDGAVGTLLIGETVTEETSNITGIVIYNSGTALTLLKVTGLGYFTNDRTLTGGQSAATVEVNNAGTTKNADQSCRHETGFDAKRFDIELYIYEGSTFSWTNAKRVGRFIASDPDDTARNINYEVIAIDTNNIKVQTGSSVVRTVNEDGTCLSLSANDYSFNVIIKMVF